MEITYQIEEIETTVEKLLKALSSKVILFHGSMGAGKTTLIKSLVKVLGSTDPVSSPTFSIVNEYTTAQDYIYHFDFYRIKDEEEALNFGIEEYLESGAWLLMEWPDKITNLLPDDAAIVSVTQNKDNSRTLKLN